MGCVRRVAVTTKMRAFSVNVNRRSRKVFAVLLPLLHTLLADFRNLQSPRRDFALVAAAGPASNLVDGGDRRRLAGVHARCAMASACVGYAVLLLVIVNVLLAVFNMIPIPPLDGGNVLIGVLPAPAARRGRAAARRTAFILLYGLMLSGVFGAVDRVRSRRVILGWLL